MLMNDKKLRLLIYIVAYNHEKFIKKVLDRIPIKIIEKYQTEILINDDSSDDNTLNIINEYKKKNKIEKFKITVLSNPKNQGYGGNQKIGYYYAIKHNLDFVALLHGDGQYAPEYLEQLIEPLKQSKIDAVFGSRMMIKGTALKGGMPLYKFIGNKILTFFQNLLLKTNFSEFHSGYRVYKVSSLKKVPFQLNSNDYCFDTEIIIQFVKFNLKIVELPIPTFYGDEISYVVGTKYAFQIMVSTVKANLQRFSLFYDQKFDNKIESSATDLLKANQFLEILLEKARIHAKEKHNSN